ncbi:MAG: hypothetical protein IJ593_02050, partial [Lachnospiraceae bacterium]|nr:hypothetical protein [Lachnospiraceae bacterium]
MSGRDSEERLKINKSICRNIYYMLVYNPLYLNKLELSKINIDDINSIDDILSKMLIIALEYWSKNYRYKDYNSETANLSKPKGRINIYESYRSGVVYSGKLNCTYDVIDNDNMYNRIIKLAINKLIQYGSLDQDTVNELLTYRKMLSDVYDITIDEYRKHRISYNEMPNHYRPVINTCEIVIDSILYMDKPGENIGKDIRNAALYEHIFEGFVREFYKQYYKKTDTRVSREVLISDGTESSYDGSFEEQVKYREITDILIKSKGNVTIIDCKWYSKTNIDNNIKWQLHGYADAYSNKHMY